MRVFDVDDVRYGNFGVEGISLVRIRFFMMVLPMVGLPIR
jgi:hypothetical protein